MTMFGISGGTFAGLERAASGLRASQAGFEVTQHNIMNANTEGYSRQAVNLQSFYPYTTPGQTAPVNPQQVGSGVMVDSIRRYREQWLDDRARDAQQSLGFNEQANDLLSQTENLFSDPGGISDMAAFNPSDYGLRAVMQDYFNAWHEVGNFPESSAQREVLLERASEMAGKFRDMYSGMEDVRNNADQLVADRVQQSNRLLTEIANLNGQIRDVLATNNYPNDLLDQRDLKVTELSKMMDVSTREQPDGSIMLYLRGDILVQEDRVVDSFTTFSNPSLDDHLSVALASDPTVAADIRGGEIAGILYARDVQIKGFENDLNTLAGQIVTQTNGMHTAGFDLSGTAGVDFFTAPAPGENAAQVMTVALTTGDQIAASATAAGAPGDGARAFDHAALAYNRLSGLNDQSTVDFYAGLSSDVGVAVQTTQRNVNRFSKSLEQIDGQQSEIAGVNLDEEFLNITKYQRAYEAASRALSNFDDLLNIIINRTGRVGL